MPSPAVVARNGPFPRDPKLVRLSRLELVLPCFQRPRGEPNTLCLPVAPRCNLECLYCDRSGDCVHHSTRCSRSQLLTPQQAVRYALDSLEREPHIARVGVHGPGDALASADSTLGALSLLRRERVDLPFFIATNGFGLIDHADELNRVGVSHCIVTINGVDPEVLNRLVGSVHGPDGLLVGTEATRLLIERQLSGVRALVQRQISVRVDFHLVPGINETEVAKVAESAAAAGAQWFHVQPFEPPTDRGAPFAGIPSPDDAACARARDAASAYLDVVPYCSQCDADSLACMSETRVLAAQEALELSSKQKDIPSEVRAERRSDPPESAERTVAVPHLQFIAKTARWLATSVDDTLPTLRRVLAWLDEDLGLRRGVIALLDGSGDMLQAQVTHGVTTDQAERMQYRPDEGVTGQVLATGRAVMIPSLSAAPEFLDRSGLRGELDLGRLAFFCVPILDRGSVIGTLSADKDNTLLKDADSDLQLLSEVACLLAPYVQRRRLEESLALFRRLRSTEGPFARLVGRSAIMDEVRRMIAKVAPTTTTVLFTGETGTGKSAAAALVHELSSRAQGPFLEVNCGAIPSALIESELFGHERGAFTGALQRRLGVFERARGGTVFLDEVGELEASAQTRLLRVIQTHRFERVGGSETLTTDVRLVAATNKDLTQAVADGTFRSDLYYRLNVFPILMPPLRERGKADLMLLADSFVDRYGRSMGKRIFRIDTPAIDMITAYHWPGNVRELENVIERAVVLAEGDVIHGHHLPPSLQMNRYAASPEVLDFNTRVANFESELITEALKDTSGNQTKAAQRLGITKRVIQYKIRSYGIPWERFVPRG